MTDLRAYARNKPCQVRLPCCNGNVETTVLAHARIIGISGIGMKGPDLLGAWCCSKCHAYADKNKYTEVDFLRGCLRTQNELIKAGLVSW